MYRLPALTALLLAFVPALWAHETDQFTIPGDREVADIGPYLNRWVYAFIDRAVEKTNERIRHAVESGDTSAVADLQSASHIVHAVNGEIPWAMDVIEGYDKISVSAEMP